MHHMFLFKKNICWEKKWVDMPPPPPMLCAWWYTAIVNMWYSNIIPCYKWGEIFNIQNKDQREDKFKHYSKLGTWLHAWTSRLTCIFYSVKNLYLYSLFYLWFFFGFYCRDLEYLLILLCLLGIISYILKI